MNLKRRQTEVCSQQGTDLCLLFLAGRMPEALQMQHRVTDLANTRCSWEHNHPITPMYTVTVKKYRASSSIFFIFHC